MLKGSFVALVTPFKNNKVDEEKLRELVEFQIKNGTNGLVPCGTTGESPTLSYEEHERVIEVVVEQAKKRVPVIAGTGANSTTETIEMSEYAKKVGADAVLLVVPYYNKPTQKGLVLHFKKVAKDVNIPMVIYNIPGRTGVNMLPDTIIKVAKETGLVVGVKEASGNVDQTSELVKQFGDKIPVLSGDDSLTLPIMSVGGYGVISVLANIAPKDVHDMCAAYLKGDLKTAQALHLKAFTLIKTLFIETNPIPIKTAAGIMGLCSDELRLPLAPMDDANKEKLRKEMSAYGLLK
ncbi:MAG: 4-hydroxy-tetrahydrodipicolinate synthase [Elusimicrobiota bacterium]